MALDGHKLDEFLGRALPRGDEISSDANRR